jgi:hypothetical protein
MNVLICIFLFKNSILRPKGVLAKLMFTVFFQTSSL